MNESSSTTQQQASLILWYGSHPNPAVPLIPMPCSTDESALFKDQMMLANIRLLAVSSLLVIQLPSTICAFEPTSTRRAAIAETLKVGSGLASLSVFGIPAIARAAHSNTPIADRLDATTLKLPPPSMGSEVNGVGENVQYEAGVSYQATASYSLC